MEKIVYIIPGHEESYTRQNAYGRLGKIFEKHGFTTVQVRIDWSKKPGQFKEYLQQFMQQYKKPHGAEVYVLGFSFGATTAFLSAPKTRPTAFIFCSLSPYFLEDQKDLRPAWLKYFKENMIDSDYSFAKLAGTIRSKSYFVVGSEEHASCIVRSKDAHKQISNSSLTIAKGAKHKIGQKEYLATLERLIKKL